MRGGAALLNVDRAAYAVRDGEVVELKAFFSTASRAGSTPRARPRRRIDTLGDVLPQLGRPRGHAGRRRGLARTAAPLVHDGIARRAAQVATAPTPSRPSSSATDSRLGGSATRTERLATTLAAQLSLTLRNVHAYQREHEIAEEFQNALLEPPPAIDRGRFGVRYVPAGQAARVGGDFYDFVRLGPRRFMVAIGDVCGRGLDAAVQTAMVRYMLRAYVAESSPGESPRAPQRDHRPRRRPTCPS